MGKKKLALDLGDDDAECDFNLDNTYAKKYDNWRRKQELSRLKDKYRDGEESDDSETSQSSVEWTQDDETGFLRALGALKSNDPKIYENNIKFFDPNTKNGVEKKPKVKKTKKAQKMTLRDYEEKLVTEREGRLSEDEEDVQPSSSNLTYIQQEAKLKNEFKSAVAEVDDNDDDGNFLTKRVKTEDEIEKEENEYHEWLKGQKDLQHIDDELKGLKTTWENPDLDEGEKFLRDYLLNKKYETDEIEVTGLPTYDEIIAADEEEDCREKFETKYNFRFEDPDQEFIKQYPRTIAGSLRREDNTRKEKRERREQRKEEEKKQRLDEIKQLKNMKRSEIEEKLAKLRTVTGDETLPVRVEDLEGDFDPAEYDRRMREMFSTYEDNGVEEEEKPVFSDMSDLELEEDEEEEEEEEPEEDEEIEVKQSGGDTANNRKNSKKAKIMETQQRKKPKQSKFREALKKPKPVFDPKEKTFEEYFNEYYALDYEDIIGDDMRTKFRYRKVDPNDYGLSTEEILSLEDKQLNAWASLKMATAYNTAEEERQLRSRFEVKSQRVDKHKVFSSVLTNKQLQLPKAENVEENGEQEGEKRKRKRGGKKMHNTANVEEPVPAPKQVETNTEPDADEGERRKRKRGGRKRRHGEIDSERLKAYNVNTRKLKKALYSKK